MDVDKILYSALNNNIINMLDWEKYYILMVNPALNTFKVTIMKEVCVDGIIDFALGNNDFEWMPLGLVEDENEALRMSLAIEINNRNYEGKIITDNIFCVLEGHPERNEFRISTLGLFTLNNIKMLGDNIKNEWALLGIFGYESGAREWQHILRMYIKDKDGNLR